MKKHTRSKNTASSSSAEPDIAGFMTKIQEQLAALDRKLDAWIGQIAARSFTGEGRIQPVSSPAVIPHPNKETVPVLQAPRQGHPQGRRERTLYKAVCADCQKDCEVPFKPTGERPVYCKSCFSKRKNGGPSKNPAVSPQPVVQEHRQIKVTPNGAGKVTVSEVVTSSARGTSSKRKPHKPASKSKR